MLWDWANIGKNKNNFEEDLKEKEDILPFKDSVPIISIGKFLISKTFN